VEEHLKIEIEKLPWSLVLIAAGLEGITVSILPYAATLQSGQPISKPPETGLLLGYIGMLTAIVLANLLAGRLLGRSFNIHRPLIVSIWGGIFLALIFLFQAVFRFSSDNTLDVMLRAAFSLAASTLVLLLLYRWTVQSFRFVAVDFTWGVASMRVVKASTWVLVVYLAVYEAIALPIIEVVREVEQYRFFAGLGLGLLAGALACAAVIAIYNALSRSFPQTRLTFVVERKR